jgi:hypothetical protein
MRWLILLVGCYAPATPSGAYRCSVSDSTCPTRQHCVCGLCVNQDGDAACGFSVNVSGAGTGVAEHQRFPVTIQALQSNGTPAAGFDNTVTLSFVLPDGSQWGDVSPSTVQLKGGSATADVTLNRETIPPQKPKLRVAFAGNQSDSSGIVVNAPQFMKDPMPIVAPATPMQPFGFAATFAAEPAVLHDSTGYRMYFVGLTTDKQEGIGVATSADGKTFTAWPDPVFKPANGTWYSGSVQGPAPFFSDAGVTLAFTGTEVTLDPTPPGEIGVATSADGLTPFTVGNNGQAVIRRTTMMHMADCDYCGQGVDFANVVDDPDNPDCKKGSTRLMFFSGNTKASTAVIGRASSTDCGKTWVPEPAPVLQGELGGEALLVSPHVIKDGTVYKMWYSFARLADVLNTPTDFCDTPVHVGYATSSDGFYWVRSPTNVMKPPLSLTQNGWDAGIKGFLVGTALPSDGNDPANGIAVYYTTLRHVVPIDPTSQCVPNGIGRATRP